MPFVSAHTWQFLLADRSNSVLADLSGYALDPVVSARLSVPSMQTWTIPCIPEALGAGFLTGQRRGIAIRDGQVVANDILWRTKPAGGPNSGYMTAEFIGPMIEWGTSGSSPAGRYCRDENGQVFDGPSADGTDRGLDLPDGIIADPTLEVGAGEILRQALANTITWDGPLSVTLGGPFNSTPPPGEGFAFSVRNMSPLLVSELATTFIEAGACEILITPHMSGSTQGSVSAVDHVGGSVGATFDYGTGANNVAWAYPESDMDDICTKLWFELGLREGAHFKNNVTIDAPGVTVDPSGNQSTYGVWHGIQMHPVWSGAIPTRFPAFTGETKPWTGAINPLYQMYVRRYNAELASRMDPRTIVRIQPQAGLAPEPWTDYNLGDTPGLNIAQLGIDLTGVSFRIIGWDTTVERGGAERTQPLIGWAP